MDDNKLLEYEKIPLITYIDFIGLTSDVAPCLYHGIRFDVINRLESIFQMGSILCGNRVPSSFKSYDGSIKNIYINYSDKENCNMGKYVSVMPYEDGVEFDTFIKQNVFFAIKSTVDAYKTIHLSFDDYCDLKQSKIEFKNLYSYAGNEYFVKDEISLDDVLYIGINSRYYSGNYDEIVNEIKKLMDVYKIKIPFIDACNNNVLLCYNKDRNKTKELKL